MGKRGPKPVDMKLLNLWESEFYRSFHLLRDGTLLPQASLPPPLAFSAEERHKLIRNLKKMSANEYWLTTRRLAVEMGESLNLKKPPTPLEWWSAERDRVQEISELKRALKHRGIQAEANRRKVWVALLQANTFAALRKACGRWARLPDVRLAGVQQFAKHVLNHAGQFFLMKRNKRFPRSNYADDSRLEYLARGMAGAVMKISAMTAIERLRNMNHGPGGPLWDQQEQRCVCWRCTLRRSNKAQEKIGGWYEDSLRYFIAVAASTRVPKEWKQGREGSNPW